MKKVISYRQKIIELARIYKIEKVLDTNLRLTTYEIELELLRNKVPIPSRRGYWPHKIIKEIIEPFYSSLKENLKVNINLNVNKNIKSFYNSLKENVTIEINIHRGVKKIFEGINNSFALIISSVTNFVKKLTKIKVEDLNNIYNFKVNEKIINKFILRGV